MGRWRNYEELEEDLTLAELTTTYDGILTQHVREVKAFARIMGADVKEDLDPDRFKNNRDIVEAPIYEKEGGRFGVGAGLGYSVEE